MTNPSKVPAVVALGGGHGLFATLSALRRLTSDLTAVVTVADDGGSSGRLRAELGLIPPGDLRMALAALADPNAELWTRTVQHRFRGTGALAGHSVGNLILAGLTEVLGDQVAALDELGKVLGVAGRVLPMASIPLDIEADVSGLEADPRASRCIRGQVAVATTPGKVRRVRLLPSDPPACPEAVAAIERAEAIVLGPGSWFTSVIPHVLVPELHDALVATRAVRVLVLNLAAEPGETTGFSAERHLHVLAQHAPEFTVDHVLVDSGSVPPSREREDVERAAEKLRARVTFADVAEHGTQKHDPAKLAAALDGLVGTWAVRSSTRSSTGPRMHHLGLGGKESASWR
ncbi:gluconeogenesis factor YvcK family protein [Aldersonia kunmingensis]|uniref:gluconeogenesis factor YvcK family protein n=1 Tax=Aldersonia kunmingensis TaxID=408066 RepID=UPI00082B10F6|nr:uridine diphosphate-N-acetylglucosamine-binding protein YvcK [Aldersonia kunmingensis]